MRTNELHIYFPVMSRTCYYYTNPLFILMLALLSSFFMRSAKREACFGANNAACFCYAIKIDRLDRDRTCDGSIERAMS